MHVEQLESEIVALDSRQDPALLPALRSTLLDFRKMRLWSNSPQL